MCCSWQFNAWNAGILGPPLMVHKFFHWKIWFQVAWLWQRKWSSYDYFIYGWGSSIFFFSCLPNRVCFGGIRTGRFTFYISPNMNKAYEFTASLYVCNTSLSKSICNPLFLIEITWPFNQSQLGRHLIMSNCSTFHLEKTMLNPMIPYSEAVCMPWRHLGPNGWAKLHTTVYRTVWRVHLTPAK